MILQTEQEIKNLLYYLWLVRDVVGDVAEVGVYRGGSAQVISSGLNGKHLWLYDAFKDNQNGYGDMFDFTGAFNEVQRLNPKASIIVGDFPETIQPMSALSFVHLDVDSELGTFRSLEALYPLVSVGGVIVVHDYQNPHLKVKDAVVKFGKEIDLLPNSTQCVIIKR